MTRSALKRVTRMVTSNRHPKIYFNETMGSRH